MGGGGFSMIFNPFSAIASSPSKPKTPTPPPPPPPPPAPPIASPQVNPVTAQAASAAADAAASENQSLYGIHNTILTGGSGAPGANVRRPGLTASQPGALAQPYSTVFARFLGD